MASAVDSRGALGWYYCLKNKNRFPFQARCTITKAVSQLRKGETVEVHGSRRSCSAEMLERGGSLVPTDYDLIPNADSEYIGALPTASKRAPQPL
jgi:hypothetical protein